MKRKDCDHTSQIRTNRPMAETAMLGVCLLAPLPVAAGTIRVWPTAVTTGDRVHLADVAELQGLDIETRERLSALEVGSAPEAGGSKYISLDAVRAALRDSGFNLADIRVQGASQCAVSRPGNRVTDPQIRADSATRKAALMAVGTAAVEGPGKTDTLRQTVIDFINQELQRYGGAAEVTFDRTSDQVLELSGPEFHFQVRRRGGGPLGITPLEIDVFSGEKMVQTVPLVVQVRLNRGLLTARRAINQDARIRAEDVDVTVVTLTRLDQPGMDDVTAVIGQRAKRFIPVGMKIAADMLESVPLVRRGELVTLEAAVGGISVVTAAKADADGRLNEVIRVRGLEGRREEFDAIVVGVGKVRLGGPVEQSAALALGGLK